ncbi:MAG: KEOPS complex subunit Pcc1 [Candidatus Bathyarchaeia archaeon]
MQATISLEYADKKLAKAVADALSPDNFKTPPKLTVKTTLSQRKVITVIQCESKLATFTATIDDLLFCATTAEKTVKAITKI